MSPIRLPTSPRLLSLLALTLALLAVGSVPSPSAAYTIEPGHPRLYFTAADLPALRARTTTTHATQWQALRNWPQPAALMHATYSGRDMTRTHQYIERNAFMYQMLAIADPATATARAQIARAWLMELATYSFAGDPNDAFEYIWALAIGYDWLFTWPGFSEADKQIVRTQLVARTTKQVNETGLNGFPTFPTGPDTSKSIYDNMSTENNMVSGFAGLALWEAGDPHGTNDEAQHFLDATYYRFREMYAATRAHSPDGGYWEGQGYYGARLQGEVFFAHTWRVATGEDLLAGNEHLRNAVYYWIYGIRPDEVSSREGDQTCLPLGCARNRHIASILAAYHGDPYVQWYAQYRGALAGGGWEDIALYDATVSAQPPSTLPLHRRFQFGHIVIRTGWDIGFGSDDTYFTFDIHDWVSGHTHVDSGSFTLFRRGALAIDSGRYRGSSASDHAHERNYATRTVAHNTMTVYRAGEDFGGFANDGGQKYLFQETPTTEPRFVADLATGTRFDAGTLEAFEATANYYYLKGNVTDAYHSTGFQGPSDGAAAKISNFTREIALFPVEPDPLVVVFDRVTSLQAGWPKRWLLHSIEEPQVSGPVASTEVPGHILTHDGNLVTIDHEGGRLFSRTLLPASSRLRKVGGTGYEFWVDDPGANYPLSVFDPEAGAWRVEVRPAVPATADTFLHVLSVSTDGVATMPDTRLIDAGSAYGAEAANRVVLFAKTSTPVQDIAYTVESDGPVVRHLLTGMLPGLYAVAHNGAPVPGSPLTSSGDRTLKFQTPGGGSVSATWLSGQADLVVTGLTGVPAGANPGASVTVSDTVANKGSATAGASATRYYLSVDTALGPDDIPMTGSRPVATLAPGAISAGSATLAVPAGAPHDLYFVLACADGAGAVGEGSEGNNCKASGPMRVGVADLAVTEVTDPPANIRAGLSFQLIVTTANLGTAVSGASTVRFYLSLNTARDASDVLLTGSRAVPALIPGEQATSLTSATVPAATPPGFYYLIACADWGGVVVESDELDNCLASAATMEVRVPDLVVTSASTTPTAVAPGSKLTVSDTTQNQGIVDAAASKTRYYLSIDTAFSANDKLLTGGRAIPPLGAGLSSSGHVTVTVPAATAIGTYYVLACADDMKVLGEVSETNNCRATAAVTVGAPNLVVDAADHVASSVKRGRKLAVTDTTRNKGTAPTGKTTRVRYYLSANNVLKLLSGYRPVPDLAADAVSSGGINVTVPTNTVPGDYFLVACADDTGLVAESNENNNCRTSATQVTILP